MKRLLSLILAIVVLAAPIPALAMKAMCADAMPTMAAMDHGMTKDSCCDDEHKRHIQKRWSWFGAFARRAPYASAAVMIAIALYMGVSGWIGVANGSHSLV